MQDSPDAGEHLEEGDRRAAARRPQRNYEVSVRFGAKTALDRLSMGVFSIL
jgi:hypothetical protein